MSKKEKVLLEALQSINRSVMSGRIKMPRASAIEIHEIANEAIDKTIEIAQKE